GVGVEARLEIGAGGVAARHVVEAAARELALRIEAGAVAPVVEALVRARRREDERAALGLAAAAGARGAAGETDHLAARIGDAVDALGERCGGLDEARANRGALGVGGALHGPRWIARVGLHASAQNERRGQEEAP